MLGRPYIPFEKTPGAMLVSEGNCPNQKKPYHLAAIDF